MNTVVSRTPSNRCCFKFAARSPIISLMASNDPTTDPECPPQRLILLTSGERADMLAEARRLMKLIGRHSPVDLVDLAGNEDLSQREFDLAIILGGDGSILRAAH